MSLLPTEWSIQSETKAFAQRLFSTYLSTHQRLKSLCAIRNKNGGWGEETKQTSSLELRTKNPKIGSFPHHSHCKTTLWKILFLLTSLFILSHCILATIQEFLAAFRTSSTSSLCSWKAVAITRCPEVVSHYVAMV